MFFLVVHPGGFRGNAWAGSFAFLGFFERFLDPGDQTLGSVISILFLGAVAFGFDDQDSILGDAAASELDQAFFDF